MKKLPKRWPLYGAAGLGLVIIGLVAGFWLAPRPGGPAASASAEPASGSSGFETAQWYTCSMHPWIRSEDPNGKCPICFMDLIPVETGEGAESGPRELKMTETARRLAQVRTAPVARKFVEVETRLIGKIETDETRVKRLSAWVPGRLERMYVNYTGTPVQKGEHLYQIYSPELRLAQQELLLGLRTTGERPGMGAGARPSQRTLIGPTVGALREKLRLWGLTPEQIASIEKSGEARDFVTIYAPVGGVVVEKMQNEGDYVQVGSQIYTIADLSRVWLILDAYESDLTWLRYGQPVEFTVKAWPGETFHGTIAFISPILDTSMRTTRVRVNADNPDGRLKPGMYAQAVIRSRVATAGMVMAPNLVGKWICPMHPEVVKDQTGTCDVCGMPLVTAESLGYASATGTSPTAPLVVPASAPLVTGKRAVVYVADPNREGVFEGREVVLGPRAGDHYVVKSGLREGESVVVEGAFKIDSSLQIQAKPSMMSPDDETAKPSQKDEKPMLDMQNMADMQQQQAVGGGGERELPDIDEQRENYPLDVCVVSGEKLGSMGEPVEVVVDGRLFRLCCEGCVDAVKTFPERYLKKLDEAATKREDKSPEEGDKS